MDQFLPKTCLSSKNSREGKRERERRKERKIKGSKKKRENFLKKHPKREDGEKEINLPLKPCDQTKLTNFPKR